jgi:2-methylisocitrate lyase-like PEP mutase family enzyme
MSAGATFRALHRPGSPFILANAWDRGSARMLVALGAQAVATSSAAHAFTLGQTDGVTRDQALAHAADLVAAVPVPVQGDFENGFGAAPGTCAETVRLAAEAGLAGICIEDTDLPGTAPYPFDLAVERIRAAAAAARALPQDFVLTARADGVMLGSYDMAEATRRLRAFGAAGADCLYAPLVPDLDQIAALCRAVDQPVNVLVAGAMARHSLADFAAAGVARLSLGSSLARATHRVIHDAGAAMFGVGDFSPLLAGMSGDQVDSFLAKGSRKT